MHSPLDVYKGFFAFHVSLLHSLPLLIHKLILYIHIDFIAYQLFCLLLRFWLLLTHYDAKQTSLKF